MTDNTELKQLAQQRAHGQMVCSAKDVLDLFAENERLAAACERAEQVINAESKAAAIATGRANLMQTERDQLKAENERIRADYAGLASFNPEWDRVAAAQDSVREHMAMVVQLKAEVAGLKTGYEAYERVNAELKAEVEESASVIDQLAKILAGVAVALKGEELPLHRHGYHDLVKCVTVLKLENDLRKGENEALRKELAAVYPFKPSGNGEQSEGGGQAGHKSAESIDPEGLEGGLQ